MLRAMGLNIAKDQELQNHLRHLLCMPDLNNETFEDVYVPQAESKPTAGGLVDNPDDTAENIFEQNDARYT